MSSDLYRQAGLRTIADSPRVFMWLCFATIIASAWAFLAVMSPQMAGGGYLFIDLIRAICTPAADPWSPSALVWVFVMWSAMAFAMMLPTAAPMLATYMDIAGAAREKDMDAVSPLVLAAGYLTVWLGFSIVATVVQASLKAAGWLDANDAFNHPILAGAVLIGAGLYQFTPLKHACLTKCRQPMPFFLANWRDTVSGVFGIGWSQGLFCLGCCWALMLVMFVTGLMNLTWMAAVGLAMVLEKTLADARAVTYGLATILLVSGSWFLVRALFVE